MARNRPEHDHNEVGVEQVEDEDIGDEDEYKCEVLVLVSLACVLWVISLRVCGITVQWNCFLAVESTAWIFTMLNDDIGKQGGTFCIRIGTRMVQLVQV